MIWVAVEAPKCRMGQTNTEDRVKQLRFEHAEHLLRIPTIEQLAHQRSRLFVYLAPQLPRSVCHGFLPIAGAG
jgi:hypothetical protein